MQFSLKYGGEEHRLEAKGSHVIAPELTVEVERRDMPEFDAVKWTLWLSNPSDKRSAILSDICDCDTYMPIKGKPFEFMHQSNAANICVTYYRGIKSPWGEEYANGSAVVADEFAPYDDYLRWAPRTRSYESNGGCSSNDMMPFFDVHADGAGAMVAIGWSGCWKATFKADDDGVNVKTGLKVARFYLEPGEKLRTTAVLVMNYRAGEDKSNKFRRLIAKYFSHRTGAPQIPDGLLAFNFWGGLPSAEMLKRLDRVQKAGLPFEALWIDAGWYGDCLGNGEERLWSDYTGDWTINKNTHPNGLTDVRDALKDNRHILLWFEPERLTGYSVKKVKELREHPEWLLKTQEGDWYLLNYGAKGAIDFVFDAVSSLIDKLHICCYRQDFNMRPEGTFRKYECNDRQGIVEIKHISGMYELLDRLHARYSDLIIDNCASGGRRIDIETLSRSIVLCRSDYICQIDATPEIVQTQNANLSSILPYTGCFYRDAAEPYAARSYFASTFGWSNYSTNAMNPSDEDIAAMCRISEEYLRIREYFSKDFYNHGSNAYDLSSWAIWQYHDPETGSGIVMAFRRPQSACDRAKITLKGLPAGVKLKVESLDDGSTYESGADMTITLDKPRSSAVFMYKKA